MPRADSWGYLCPTGVQARRGWKAGLPKWAAGKADAGEQRERLLNRMSYKACTVKIATVKKYLRDSLMSGGP